MNRFPDLRKAFPFFGRQKEEEERIYLDSAGTSLSLGCSIDAMEAYLNDYRANIHSGGYRSSMKATEAYEAARREVARFIDAAEPAELIFTAGTTDAVNMAANGWSRGRLGKGKAIVATQAEHHSNFLPWRRAAQELGVPFRIIPVTEEGGIDYSKIEEIITPDCGLVAVTALSNVSGEVVDLESVIARAKACGALVFVDGAQAAARIPLSVRRLDIDFLAFSGHKCYGTTGCGILYGKRKLLEKLPPFRLGGGMVRWVDEKEAAYASLPALHEGGTPDIGGAVALGSALHFLRETGMEAIYRHECMLTKACTDALAALAGVQIIDVASRPHCGVVSFRIEGVHPHDAVTFLDSKGIELRGGLHCAHPLHTALHWSGSIRASFGIYSTEEEVETLTREIKNCIRFFR
ncbi:aminotransferase class V-fold PLP-dependent enzyme [Sediminispirochaeta bajacaliforniensis]|uniref:aminotransferase class V-fold PLP-dependent enzyme n=1 Tax=Sediminispirochaeta bajacaliforniensis TaxID=148 RepID=UPI00036CB912|nr:cysteine desulfurase [Sediminispirochaeta bajacaliforniensis]